MSIYTEKKGLIIFGAILIVVLIAALAAYQMTGSMGIEDRYSQAVGLPVSGDTASGFSLEGSPVLYAVILFLLCAVCWGLYRKYGKP